MVKTGTKIWFGLRKSFKGQIDIEEKVRTKAVSNTTTVKRITRKAFVIWNVKDSCEIVFDTTKIFLLPLFMRCLSSELIDFRTRLSWLRLLHRQRQARSRIWNAVSVERAWTWATKTSMIKLSSLHSFFSEKTTCQNGYCSKLKRSSFRTII